MEVGQTVERKRRRRKETASHRTRKVNRREKIRTCATSETVS